jgi:hypothetical protein
MAYERDGTRKRTCASGIRLIHWCGDAVRVPASPHHSLFSPHTNVLAATISQFFTPLLQGDIEPTAMNCN